MLLQIEDKDEERMGRDKNDDYILAILYHFGEILGFFSLKCFLP